MALWAPYKLDEPLDLSLRSKNRTSIPESPQRVPGQAALHNTNGYTGLVNNNEDSMYTCSPLISPAESSGSSVSAHLDTRQPIMIPSNPHTDPNFLKFRDSMLRIMLARNGGSQCVTNPRMRRSLHRTEDVTPEYQEKRQRNNAAAKRSRDSRKIKEQNMTIRAVYLAQINADLKSQIMAARELAALRSQSC